MKVNRKKYTLTGAGSEIANFDVNDNFESYTVYGSATAIGNYAISVTGSPTEQDEFKLLWRASLDITTNSTTFSILGQSITANQLLYDFDALCTYNGSTWDVDIQRSETGVTTETNNIRNNAVTNSKLAQMSAHTIKANNTGSTADPQDVSASNFTTSYAWGLQGNSGTTPGTNFIGTTDQKDLVFKVNNSLAGRIGATDINTSFGLAALDGLTSGQMNTAYGAASLTHVSSGSENTAFGENSLVNLVTGGYNTSIGAGTGAALLSGDYNTLIGHSTNVSLNSQHNSIALGYAAITNTNYQFALPDDVINVKWRGVNYVLPSALPSGDAVLHCDASGNLTWV